MNRKLILGITLTLLLMSMLTFFLNPKVAQASILPTMYVDPPIVVSPSLTPGSTFTVDIMISDADYYEGTDVWGWQVCMVWDPTVIDIDDTVVWGDFLDTPRIGPWGILIADAAAGQKIVNVLDGYKYQNPSAWGGVVLIQDDFNSEWNEIESVTGYQLTMKNNLTNTYAVADNGGCYPKPDLFAQAIVNPTRTRMIAGVVSIGPTPGVSGSGWLCTFTFHVLDTGESDLDIDYHPVLWSYTYIMNMLLEVLGDEEGELIKEIGYFSNEPLPPISVYTDKSVYSLGETMHLGLDINNPVAYPITVCVAIWLERPSGPNIVLLHAHALTLPGGFTYINPSFDSFVLPSMPTGNYTWHAALLNPSPHAILMEDTAEWEFS